MKVPHAGEWWRERKTGRSVYVRSVEVPIDLVLFHFEHGRDSESRIAKFIKRFEFEKEAR